MADWIPDQEPEFDKLLVKYGGFLSTNFAALGVTAGTKDTFLSLSATYGTARNARLAYEAQADLVYATFSQAKSRLVEEWRTLNKEITGRRTLTVEQRAGLGLPALDAIRSTAPVPASKPVIVKVDATQRLHHIIHWVDENTPGSKAKPAGVVRAILFLKIGAAPTGPADMPEVADDRATPYIYEFDAADAGKTAHWALCWENASGERGPCSAASSWTIPG